MPSLFSRVRTNSTPQKKNTLPSDSNYGAGSLDEFGRVSSRASNRGVTLVTPSKKDKKKEQKRSKTLPVPRDDLEQQQEPAFPDGAFLPLNLEKPRNDAAGPEQPKELDYGYLCYERHVVLGIEQVERLVDIVSEELETRGGITTPFIFSTTALDISSTAIKRLIRSFLNTCDPQLGHKAQEAEYKWREEARFAGPHELGMCLRWGLARVIRSVGGQDVRGLVSWDHYADFRDSEAVNAYPSVHFATHFLPTLPHALQAIIIRLLSLISRLVANSTSSGHTPPTLSPLFGPLFFGLGPATLAFQHAYGHYLRAVHAMEHIILSFIRWQDTPKMSVSSSTGSISMSASASSMGVPVRLKEWIKGYPSMLTIIEHKKPQPRRGARTVRLMSVRRNVRMYSPDLVKTASTWAHRPPGSPPNHLAASKEWERISPPTLKLPPRYSETYKKRMDLPTNFHPDTAPGTAINLNTSISATSSASSPSTLLPESDYFGMGGREGEDRFRSLTDLKWGEFESSGFGGLGDEKKLQFDLTESARTERAAKRQTLSWNDFSSSGFTRMDAPLSATLQFSAPFVSQISQWPEKDAEMNKKLKKTQKSLPSFGWDTEPVVGSEEMIEEAFIDVFCDLIYGGGWMDLERGEMLDRDCNWALVEYKSLPAARSTISGSGTDPRTANTLILFEEFVPLEYREQLAIKSSNRRRLPSLFTSGKKQWKQAQTLNGRPYVVGHVPRSPSYREVEFERMLHGNNATKVITLTKTPRVHSVVTAAPLDAPREPPPPLPQINKNLLTPSKLVAAEPAESHPAPRSDELHSDSTMTPSHRKSRFRLPPTPGSNRKSMIPAEYSTVEFETRMASYSDDEHNATLNEPEDIKQKRRESSTDAWVDILVGSQSRRFGGQDAELTTERRRGGPLNKQSDPEMASKEVAQVLAAVRSLTPPSLDDNVDPDFEPHSHIPDSDVDEIETVPRRSNARSESETEEEVALAYDQSEDGHNAHAITASQRRLGYFDLHPERRNATQSMIDEDPRDKLAQDESDPESDDEGYDESIVRGSSPSGRPSGGIRPLPAIPPVAVNAQPVVQDPVTPPKVVPSSVGTNGSSEKATPSKTAALIEMYRERERGVPTPPKAAIPVAPVPIVITPLAPSRLPVRSASLPKEPSPAPAPAPAASPVPPPVIPLAAAPALSPKVSPQPSPEPGLMDLPRIALEETGRNSPARYVHGAPLHNVVEEEEEE